MCSHCVFTFPCPLKGTGYDAMWSLSQYGQSGLFSNHIARGKLQWDGLTSRVFVGHQTAVLCTPSVVTNKTLEVGTSHCTLPFAMWLVNNEPVKFNAVAWASTTSHHSASSHTTVQRRSMSLYHITPQPAQTHPTCLLYTSDAADE